MLNQTGKNHFTQVAMIQSQYQSKRKNMIPHSSLLNNKSPLRQRQYERQNYNNMNTPTRMPASRIQLSNNSSMINNNGINKISLSPLRSRRNNNNNEASITSIKSSAISRRKATEPMCDQHNNKQAEFILESEGQCFYFCQICAIPLIAQGFPCTKIQQNKNNGYFEEENPRLKQINHFLKSVDQLTNALNDKKSHLTHIFQGNNKILTDQKQKISQYYEQFHELINEHMSRVIQQMEVQYHKSIKDLQTQQYSLNESLKTMKQMKDDIVTSMNSVIVQASEADYRSVMDQYHTNLDACRKHKNINYEELNQSNKVRRLVFGESDPILEGISQVLGQELKVSWDDQLSEQKLQEHHKEQFININNVGKCRKTSDMAGNQLESERENPIECLQTQQRNKSNLKQLGGLFCSFDD